MAKLVVSINEKNQLIDILKKDISGVIIYVNDLSVNSSFYMTIDEIINYDFNDKEVFICLNKIMHNSDLELLRNTLTKLIDFNCKILFYDMAIYNIAKELNILDKLIIYQDHLNASSYSNNYYHKLGISGSYLTSDITYEELINIRKNYQGNIMFTVYGYLPIFYSRRYLITNYLKYLGSDKKSCKYTIKGDDGVVYPITEEKYGTTVYTSNPVNLINKLKELNNIDYLVLNGILTESETFDNIIDKFINQESMDDCYLGFYHTKTIYRVKGE